MRLGSRSIVARCFLQPRDLVLLLLFCVCRLCWCLLVFRALLSPSDPASHVIIDHVLMESKKKKTGSLRVWDSFPNTLLLLYLSFIGIIDNTTVWSFFHLSKFLSIIGQLKKAQSDTNAVVDLFYMWTSDSMYLQRRTKLRRLLTLYSFWALSCPSLAPKPHDLIPDNVKGPYYYHRTELSSLPLPFNEPPYQQCLLSFFSTPIRYHVYCTMRP